MLSDTIGEQVSVWRKRRNWNRERLAEECARRGMPELTHAALTNIESGRRQHGVRRRAITTDELAVLAHALDVPPVMLVCPFLEQQAVELFPGAAPVPAWSALEWFSGNGLFAHEDMPANHEQYDETAYPIMLLRQHAHLVMMREDLDQSIRRLRQQLRERNCPAAVLPPELARLAATSQR